MHIGLVEAEEKIGRVFSYMVWDEAEVRVLGVVREGVKINPTPKAVEKEAQSAHSSPLRAIALRRF